MDTGSTFGATDKKDGIDWKTRHNFWRDLMMAMGHLHAEEQGPVGGLMIITAVQPLCEGHESIAVATNAPRHERHGHSKRSALFDKDGKPASVQTGALRSAAANLRTTGKRSLEAGEFLWRFRSLRFRCRRLQLGNRSVDSLNWINPA